MNAAPPTGLLTTVTLRGGVAALCARDRDLSRIVERHGPPPLWARRPGFATLVRILLEQQVSLASARAAYTRLQGVVGRVTPLRVVSAGQAAIRRGGLTRQKASYCVALAESIADGRFRIGDLTRLDDCSVRAALLDVRGVGPWTADIYLLMALRRPDVWPWGDLALPKAAQRAKRLRRRPSQERLRRMALAWSPWRAVAARLLWHAYLSE